MRYVVEVKDQFGWIDYASFATEFEAITEAKELLNGFGNVKVIDKENMVEVRIG
jgi:hypothetical protein